MFPPGGAQLMIFQLAVHLVEVEAYDVYPLSSFLSGDQYLSNNRCCCF